MPKAAKKTVKKVPKVASSKSAAAKAPKKEAKKPAKPVLKPAKKAVAPVAPASKAKASVKADDTAAAKTDSSGGFVKKMLAKVGIKTDKTKKKPKRDDDEELLPEPMEAGGEDLPDLNEFDENEEAEPVEDLDDDLEDDDLDDDRGSSSDDEIILTDAEGRRYCKVKDCDQISSVDTYCRFHYLLLWKKIQVRRKILVDGKLDRYIEELTTRYPDKFLEMIRRDMKTEKDFQAAIAELEIDEANLDGEYEDEAQNYIDEVRGVSETGMSEEEEF